MVPLERGIGSGYGGTREGGPMKVLAILAIAAFALAAGCGGGETTVVVEPTETVTETVTTTVAAEEPTLQELEGEYPIEAAVVDELFEAAGRGPFCGAYLDELEQALVRMFGAERREEPIQSPAPRTGMPHLQRRGEPAPPLEEAS